MKKASIVLSVFCLTLCTPSPIHSKEVGFNLERVNTLDQEDFNDMRQFYGASLVRLSFAATPLYDYDESSFRWRRNQANFDLLDQKLIEIKRAGLVAVVDPHRIFATGNIFTLKIKSRFWQDSRHGEAWAEAIADLAGYLDKSPHRAHVWGIDLINEPAAFVWRRNQGIKEGDPNRYTQTDINVVYRNMVSKIRNNNKRHRLILMFFEEDFRDGTVKSPNFYLGKLPASDKRAAKSKLYFSSHIYWPNSYTFQGLHGRESGKKWPGNSSYISEGKLDQRLKWITNWQAKYQVRNDRIFIGEWGLAQGNNLAWNSNTSNPSNGGRRWMDQVFSHIRQYHWTVHQYGGNPLFNINAPVARRYYIRSLMRDTSPPKAGTPSPHAGSVSAQDIASKSEACFTHKSTGRLMHYDTHSNAYHHLNTVTGRSDNTRWGLVDAGSGFFHLQHKPTGRLVHYNATASHKLNMITGRGNNTRWRLIDAGSGFFHLQHKTTGRLIHYNPDSLQDLNTGIGRGDNTKWKFDCP